MRMSVEILFAPVVEALKIFFDEQMDARLGRSLYADLVALRPLRNHMFRNRNPDGLAIESRVNRFGVKRALQSIN